MANYTIDRSLAAAGSITVTEATTDTSTNVTLIGQNFTGYGDEIATNFLQMLENFAADVPPNTNPRVPGSSAITGQLWYDTTNSVLKVYGGTAWEEQAKINTGTTESSVLRWNDTNGRYQEEERIRVSDAGSLVIANDATATNSVTFNHGGTNLTATFAGTTDFTIAGLSGDLTVTGGRGLSVEQGATALAIRAGGSSDINFTTASANVINFPSAVTLQTGASSAARTGLNIPEGTAPSSPNDGDVWVTAAGNFFARLNGATVDLAAAAGGTVTSTGSPADNQLAVWTAVSDQLEGDANLTWNGTTLAVTGAITATSFGGITSANLVDRSAPGTLAATTFSAAVTFQGDLDLQDNDRILFGTGDDVAVDFDGSSFVIDALVGTPDLDINGFLLVNSDSPIYGTDQASAVQGGINVVGSNTTWSTADSKIAFYDSDQTDTGMLIGTSAGSTVSFVNARLGQLNLLASNTQVVNFQSSLATFTSGGVTSLELRNSFTSSNTSSAAVTDNNGNLYNVGYNETPEANGVTEDINTGSRTLSNLSIGKIFIRTTSTSRTLTLPNDSTIPEGATVLVNNDTGSGTFTIVEGGGVTLEWVDGSGSSAPTGTRTLAQNSIATIRKRTNTLYQIWGNGIS